MMAVLSDRLRGGGACAVTGEPGSGRSALLAHVARTFTAGPVVTVGARAGEFREPLAGFRALCHAAGTAVVGEADAVPELVGALRSSTAAHRTVLLCVDDAHLWDAASRSALGRLAAQLPDGGRVALLFTVAGHRPADPEFAGLPLLRLAPLPPPDSAALLDDLAQGGLDPGVRDEISTAAEGNPGLLLRVFHRLTPAQLRGLAPLPRPVVDAETLTALAGGHLTGTLPGQRDLLLVTAAASQVTGEATVDADLARRAAARLSEGVSSGLGPSPRPLADENRAAPDSGPPSWRFDSSEVRGGPCRVSPYGPHPAVHGGGDSGEPSVLGDGDLGDRGDSGDSRFPAQVAPLPEPLHARDGRIGFRSTLVCRTVYAEASAERRRAAHDALARALPDGRGVMALLHRSWAATAPAPSLASDLAAATVRADPAVSPVLRCTALARAADLTADSAQQVRWYTAAAEQALLAGQSDRALRLLDTARGRPAPSTVRARAELLRGTVLRWDGPVDDARETLLLAAELFAPHDTERSAEAALAAADAAWSSGDLAACLRALAGESPDRDSSWSGAHSAGQGPGGGAQSSGGLHPFAGPRLTGEPVGTAVPSPALRDHMAGMRAVLQGRFDLATAPLRRVVDRAWTTAERDRFAQAADFDPHRCAQAADFDPDRFAHAADFGLDRCADKAEDRLDRSAHAADADQDRSAHQAEDHLDRLPRTSHNPHEEPHTAGDGPGQARTAVRAEQPPPSTADHPRQTRVTHAPDRRPRTADASRRFPPPPHAPDTLLRAAAAALLLGDTTAARRAGARALAVARADGSAGHEARALEFLAYGELRAGRHASARAHAEEGLGSAYRTGQRNTAAHHHAVLALSASIEGEAHTVTEHVTAALATARRHGLAQAATLAQWAAARADLGHGRPREAAERLGPLVRPGPGRGHFAVWMLAVPCYVEACALAGQPDEAREAVEDFARWAACDADRQAPAQLLRCRALLAPPEPADALYREALRRHGEAAGDFERARTELLYGKWLRRRRRLREARGHLRAALLGFERCGARPWAQQAAAELRANGVAGTAGTAGADAAVGGGGASAPGGVLPEGLDRLTPQQLRIARRVAQGLTNREVALSLSVSTRTVDYHLRNVFAALGVRSRVELARLVEQAEKTGAQL
ncbi:transcriptional regulator [Streptomyces sp. Ru62]|uniref:LuxR C-terminal-related transcriptional regulator n=1 Tax=Streptomyces sp. Ru62 TaxID=2080745 RepID=UPI000CDDF5FE|nr:LuxR C-terminal-related transcriptional regulator [Streptomyces sp. Ru62]POX63210.1 transcriptional regulator [Streptomyces sp. Ru62]